MGACYSKSGHDAQETPSQKKPHSKRFKNGHAIKVEYAQANTEEDDKLSESNSGGEEGKPNGGITQHTVDQDDEIEKKAVLDSAVGVAPSDSGIESLSPSEGEQSERLGNHTPNSESKDCTDMCGGGEVGSTHCTCRPQEMGHTEHTRHESNRQYKSCDSAPVTPQSEEPPPITGVEHVHVDVPHSKRSSRDLRHFDSEPSLSMYPSLQDVKTMQMDGKEVVVIDADTYGQIMEELATLKLTLSQLTDLIQLQEIEQGGSISDDIREKLEFAHSPS